MSSGNLFSRSNISSSKKLNEYQIVSSILSDIKKSEQIKIRPFDSYEIFAEELFNIFNRLILFSYQLNQSISKKNNYDSLLKQNKSTLSLDIKKFFDKISNICKSKYNPIIYSIEIKDNFSLLSRTKKNLLINYKKEELSNENIIDKIKKKIENNTNNILNQSKINNKSISPILSIKKQQKQKNFTNYKSLSQSKLLEKKDSTENLKNNIKNFRNSILKNEYFNSKKELNSQSKNLFNKTNDNYILKISKNFSKKPSKKKLNLKKSKPLKSNREKTFSKENLREISLSYSKLPNLNYLLSGENKLNLKTIESKKVKLIVDSGPKPSIYTSYLLNKYRGVIDNYNEIKKIKENSPFYYHSQTLNKNTISRSLSNKTDEE